MLYDVVRANEYIGSINNIENSMIVRVNVNLLEKTLLILSYLFLSFFSFVFPSDFIIYISRASRFITT